MEIYYIQSLKNSIHVGTYALSLLRYANHAGINFEFDIWDCILCSVPCYMDYTRNRHDNDINVETEELEDDFLLP